MPKISVILPTYNEKDNIRELAFAILSSLKYPLEIIVVDDNSPDGTWEIVEKIAAVNEHIRLLRRFNKKSLAGAIKDGISLARGDIISWMDCDFSMPPQFLSAMIKEIEDYDIVVGSRYLPGGKDARGSFLRVASSRFINFLAHFILHTQINDLSSGFIAAKKEVFKRVNISGLTGEYCIDFLYRAERAGFKIKELPYVLRPRRTGKSKLAASAAEALKNGLIYIWKVFRLRFSKIKDENRN